MNTKQLLSSDINSIKITKLPNSIAKYGIYFDKLNDHLISSNIERILKKQLPLVTQACINAKGVNVDELQQVHKHIVDTLGKDLYLKILETNTEDYNLFRTTTSIIATFAFLGLYSIYKKNPKLIVYTYYSYGIYIYTKMFQKYIQYCTASVFENAVRTVHGLSVFSKEFKAHGHLGVINKFASGEVHKLVNLINTNKYNVVVYTRSFTYIKHRMNQSFKAFAQVYHKLAKDNITNKLQDEDGISSTQAGVMVNQVVDGYKMITNIPDQYISVLIKDTNISFDDGKDFIETFIKISNNQKVMQYLHDFYQLLFKVFIDKLTEICDIQFLVILYKITTLKNGGVELVTLKGLIDKLIMVTVSNSLRKDELSKYLTKANIANFRKFYLRFTYYIYIKGALCH